MADLNQSEDSSKASAIQVQSKLTVWGVSQASTVSWGCFLSFFRGFFVFVFSPIFALILNFSLLT